MIGHLIWPVIIIILALVYRKSLIQLLARIKRVKWGEKEAELGDIAAAASDVEAAIEEAARPLPHDVAEADTQLRKRIEHVMVNSVAWGFALAHIPEVERLPDIAVEWTGDKQPRLTAKGPVLRDALVRLMVKQGMSIEGSERAADRLMAKYDVGARTGEQSWPSFR